MPKQIHANPCDTGPFAETIDVPSLPTVAWDTLVRGVCFAVLGRVLTENELTEIEKCANHGWTARVTVEHIVGHRLSTEEWSRMSGEASAAD